MANEILFPTSPSLNQVFNAPNNFTYQFDGDKWNCITTTNIGSTTIATGGDTLRNVADILGDFLSGKNVGGITLTGGEDDTVALGTYYADIAPNGTGFFPPGLLNISSVPSFTKEVLWQLQGTTLEDGTSVPALPGVVRTFVGHGELVQRTVTTSTDRAVSEFSKTTSHTGGSSSTVNATVRLSTLVNAAASDSNVGLLSIITNNGTGNNTGILVNSNLNSSISSGTHFGSQIIASDLTGGATNVPFRGLNVTIIADGNDTNAVRGGLDIYVDHNSTGFVEATYGIKLASHSSNSKFDTGITFASVTTNNAIDISGATIASSGSALKLAASQPISFTADNTHFLQYVAGSTNAFQYSNSGSVLLSIPDTGSITLGTTIAMNSFSITGLATPANPNDAATKAYVDSASQGLNVKAPAKAVSLTPLDINSPPSSIDSYNMVSGDRILLIGQTTTSQNGLYTWTNTSTTLTRTTDANSSGLVTTGMYVLITEGNVYSGTSWILNTAAPITLNTTGLTFIQFSQATQIIGGAGITVVGSTVSTNFGTTANTVAQGNDSRISGALQATNNFSDIGSAASARTNLGLGSIALQSSAAISVTGGTLNGVIIGGATPAAGSFTTLTASSGSFTGTGALQLPSGTTGQQPGSPTAGLIRYNSSTGRIEYYLSSWSSPISSTGDIMTGALTVPSITVSTTSTFTGAITANSTLSVAGNITGSSAISGNSLTIQGTSTLGSGSTNNWNVLGAATGTAPTLQIIGQDTNIPGQLLAKGNGNWYLRNSNGFIGVFQDGTSSASTINYLTFTNAADGSPIAIGVNGTGTTTLRGINYNSGGGGTHTFNNLISAPSFIITDGTNKATVQLIFPNISTMTSFNYSSYGSFNILCSCMGYRSPGDKGGGDFDYVTPALSSFTVATSSAISSGVTLIQLVSTANIRKGMGISGSGIPIGTYIVSVSSSAIQISNPTSNSLSSGVSLTCSITANSVLFYSTPSGGFLVKHWDNNTLNLEEIGLIGDYIPPTYTATSNTTASGNSTLNFSSTTGVFTGMKIYGQNIAANTVVSSSTSTTVTMSLAATGNIASGQYVGFEAPATDNTDQFNTALTYLSNIGGCTLTLTPGTQYLVSGGVSGTANISVPPNVVIDGLTSANTLSTISSFLNRNELITCLRIKPTITIQPGNFATLKNLIIMRQGLPIAPPDVPTYAYMLSQWASENGFGSANRSIAINNSGTSRLENLLIVGFNTAVYSNGYAMDWERINFHTINGLDVSNTLPGVRIIECRGRNFWSANLSASTTMTWYVTTTAALSAIGTSYAVGDLLFDSLRGLQTVTTINGSGGITGLTTPIWTGSNGVSPVNPVVTSTLGRDYNNNYSQLAGGAGSGATLNLTVSTKTIPSDLIPGYSYYFHDGANGDDIHALSSHGYQYGCIISNCSPTISVIYLDSYNGYSMNSCGVWQWNTTQAQTTIHDPYVKGFDVNLNLQGTDGLSSVIYPKIGNGNWNWIEVTDGEILPGTTGNCPSISIGTGSRGSISNTVLESYGPTTTGPAVIIAANALNWKLTNLHPTNVSASTWISIDPTSEPFVSFSGCRPIQYTTSTGGAGSLGPLPQGPADRHLWPQHISFDPSTLSPTDGSPHAPFTVQNLQAGASLSTNILLARTGTTRSPVFSGMISTSGTGVTIDTTTNFTVSSVAISNGGSNYVIGDIISGLHNDTYTVNTVSGGSITGLSIKSIGAYPSAPTNPVSTTGGSGTGATLTLTTVEANSLTLNPSGYTFATTPTTSDNSTKIATTAFVTAAINAAVIGGGSGYTLPAATSTSLGGVIIPTSSGLTLSGSGSLTADFGTGSGTIAQGNDSRIVGALQAANNLSDVSAIASRTNLGLGSIATQSSSSVNITGGVINGTTIGASTPAPATFSTITISGTQSQSYVLAAPSSSSGAPSFRQLIPADISGLGSLSLQNSTTINVTGGSVDNVTIGGITPGPGTFTTLTLTGSQTTSVVLMGPVSGSGAPTWRRVAAGDISGLGSMATQNSNAVAITGGTISGVNVALSSQTLNNTAGTTRGVTTQTSGTNRWFFGTDATTENVVTQTTSSATASGTILNFGTTSSLSVGMFVSGTNILSGTTIVSLSSTTVTLSSSVTSSGVASGASITFFTNQGSNYSIVSYNDIGSSLGTYFNINRATGNIVQFNSLSSGIQHSLNSLSGSARAFQISTAGSPRWLIGTPSDSGESSTLTLTTTASTSTGNSVLTFASTTGVVVGMSVAATGISTQTYVASLTSTTVTLTSPVTSTINSSTNIIFSSNAGSSLSFMSISDDGNTNRSVAGLTIDRLTSTVTINKALTASKSPLQLGSSSVAVQNLGAISDGTLYYNKVTGAGSQTITSPTNCGSILIDCTVAGPISSVTVVLPPNPIAGQWLTVSSTVAITSLAFTTSDGTVHTYVPSFASVLAYTKYQLVYTNQLGWFAYGSGGQSGSTSWLLEFVGGTIVTNGTYYFSVSAPYAGTINSMDWFTGAGSFTANVQIGGSSVTGLSAVSVNSSTKTNTAATGANTFNAGAVITVVVTSASSSPTNAALNLRITKT